LAPGSACDRPFPDQALVRRPSPICWAWSPSKRRLRRIEVVHEPTHTVAGMPREQAPVPANLHLQHQAATSSVKLIFFWAHERYRAPIGWVGESCMQPAPPHSHPHSTVARSAYAPSSDDGRFSAGSGPGRPLLDFCADFFERDAGGRPSGSLLRVQFETGTPGISWRISPPKKSEKPPAGPRPRVGVTHTVFPAFCDR